MNDNENTLRMSRDARDDARVGGGEKHPRVKWDEVGEARAVSLLGTDHAAC